MIAGNLTSPRRGQGSGLDQSRLVHREEGRCGGRQYAVCLHDGTEAGTNAPLVIGENPFSLSRVRFGHKQVAVDASSWNDSTHRHIEGLCWGGATGPWHGPYRTQSIASAAIQIMRQMVVATVLLLTFSVT